MLLATEETVKVCTKPSFLLYSHREEIKEGKMPCIYLSGDYFYNVYTWGTQIKDYGNLFVVFATMLVTCSVKRILWVPIEHVECDKNSQVLYVHAHDAWCRMVDGIAFLFHSHLCRLWGENSCVWSICWKWWRCTGVIQSWRICRCCNPEIWIIGFFSLLRVEQYVNMQII